MTREEIQMEINGLKEDVRNTNDLINDLVRELPNCKKADQQSLKMLSMNLPGRVFLDSENKTNARIYEERKKRDALKAKIEYLQTQLRTQAKPSISNVLQMENAMTREEIQTEIGKLKGRLETVNDYINDTIREIPQAIRDDKAMRRRMLDPKNAGMPLSGGGNEKHARKVIDEYRQERDKLKAELEELKAQLRSQPKPQSADSPRMTGVVRWYNDQKNFGFIRADGVPDTFVHKSALMESTSLREGDQITFKRIKGPKGFNAVDVRYVAEDAGEKW